MRGTISSSQTNRWSTKYPPLLALSLAIVVVLAILPSALNLPQSNPNTVPEFAPVPPDDQSAPPPGGNLSSLGLASGSSLPSGPDSIDQALRGRAAGKSPSTKECVGNPPRQTEDPLSPPCVAHFSGDNGGATYRGVTKEEVTLLFVARNTQVESGYYDLSQPAKGEEELLRRILRAWQRYFNRRYQVYGRFVKFVVQYVGGPTAQATPEIRRAQASEAFEVAKPFAVGGYELANSQPYSVEMARRGVMVFSSERVVPEDFLRTYSPNWWNYLPSSERQADQFVSYICTRIAGKPVSDSGNLLDIGQPRVYGLVYPEGPFSPVSYTAYKDVVVKKLDSQCGIKFRAFAADPQTNAGADRQYYNQAQAEMATFKREGVTTVIWTLGNDSNYSNAGAAIDYRPEWIISGDLLQVEDYSTARFQEQVSWGHAWIISGVTRYGSASVAVNCDHAWGEASGANPDLQTRTLACVFYEGLRQAFTGIQVAGPRLSPKSVESGFRAIPPHTSSNPYTPACYYLPGDHTCMKDSALMWWDPTATGPDGGSGCYRMFQGGKRYRAGDWQAGNHGTPTKDPSDPCNAYTLLTVYAEFR